MGIKNAFAMLVAGLCALLLGGAPAAQADVGIASHYSELSVTASGRSYSPNAMVAAHRTLPFGTKVKVENLSNGRTTVVTIVDRGPFISGRIIDLSIGAARNLGFADKGLQNVRMTVLGRDTSETRVATRTPSRTTRTAKVEEQARPTRQTPTRIASRSDDDDERPVRQLRSETRERSSGRVRVAARDSSDFENTHFRKQGLYLR
jgi:rare lipoprotein A